MEDTMAFVLGLTLLSCYQFGVEKACRQDAAKSTERGESDKGTTILVVSFTFLVAWLLPIVYHLAGPFFPFDLLSVEINASCASSLSPSPS